MMDFIIGIIGMSFILVGFVLDEFLKSWRQNTFRYNFVNLVGSGLLIHYAFSLNSWPFIILNAVWMTVAVIKLVGLLMKKKR